MRVLGFRRGMLQNGGTGRSLRHTSNLAEMRENGSRGCPSEREYSSKHVTLSAHDLKAFLARI